MLFSIIFGQKFKAHPLKIPIYILGTITFLFTVNVAISGVRNDWNALPTKTYYCMEKMVEAAENAPLEKIIEAGISPYSPCQSPCLKFRGF